MDRERRTETARGGPATAAAARSLAGVAPPKRQEKLRRHMSCRPSPDQRHNTRSGGTLVHSADDDERVTHPPPAASFRGNRQRKSTNKEEEDEEGDRSTQQKFFIDFFCIVDLLLYTLRFFV